MTDARAGLPTEMQRSSRDLQELRTALAAWLRGKHRGAEVGELQTTSATGMSSDTLLFDASWDGGTEHLVARLAPAAEDVPVFPSYDLGRQFELIRTVGERTPVPVPRTFWHEPDRSVIGTEFFVMSRVDGRVPPDLLPYNFGDSWLFAATADQQRVLQDATVDVLAHLHAMEPLPFLRFDEPGDTALRRHVAHTAAWYEYVAADGVRSPLIEKAFTWLDEHWPDESDPVTCWGDSRIGNVIYGPDFTPSAVLDWEMAGLGPRELDVAWLIYSHRGFEDIAHALGLDGMPHFLRRADVVERYQSRTGHELRDLDFYEVYAAVQFAIVYLRVNARSAHFGEREMPEDPNELLYNREPLERMLAGGYFGED
jgi:aminoglycoside phosphotransferase (APT) family kinase protein